MKYLKNSKNLEIIVDDEDYEKISHLTWSIRYCRNIPYVFNGVRVDGKCVHVQLHRMLLNPKIDEVIDHINGNTLDNRRENLRICSIKDNIRNSKLSKSNTSGFKGVYFYVNRYKLKPYSAAITVDRKTKHLGRFRTKKEAAIAYNNAAIEYFGEFARLNIIKE